MRDILLEEHPDCAVSISFEVWPEYREYERAMTTLVDAFMKPEVAGYLGRAEAALAEMAPSAPLLIMKSNGGVLPASAVTRRPVATALSGPAAGALGASWIAQQAGFDRVITIDTGGTSTDVCLVEGAEPALTRDGSIGRFPVRLPMIDIVSVGTGGGSIAFIGAAGGRGDQARPQRGRSGNPPAGGRARRGIGRSREGSAHHLGPQPGQRRAPADRQAWNRSDGRRAGCVWRCGAASGLRHRRNPRPPHGADSAFVRHCLRVR